MMAKRSMAKDVAIVGGAAALGFGLVYVLTRGARAEEPAEGDPNPASAYVLWTGETIYLQEWEVNSPGKWRDRYNPATKVQCWDGSFIWPERWDRANKVWVDSGQECPPQTQICTPGTKRNQHTDCWNGIPYGGEQCSSDGMSWVPITTTCPPPVKLDTTLILYNENNIYVGEDILIEGGLSVSGTPVSGKRIDITITKPNGTNLSQNATTDANGVASFVYTPDTEGQYVVNGSFAGDSGYNPSSDSTNFNAIASPVPTAKYTVSIVGSTFVVKNTAGTQVYSSTSAASAINWAFNNLTSGRTTKEIVKVMPGTYAITSSILPKSLSVLDATGAVFNCSVTSAYASGINNFEVIGGEYNMAAMTSGRLVDFVNCSYGLFEGIYGHHAYYDGLQITNGHHLTIRDCELAYMGHHGALLTVSANGKLEYCVLEECHIHDNGKVENNGGGGCYIYGAEGAVNAQLNYNIARWNLVENCRQTGLSMASLREASGSSTGNLCEYNTIIDCGFDGGHGNLAAGWGPNKAENTIIRYNCIYCVSSVNSYGLNAYVNNSEIYGNLVSNVQHWGVGVDGYNNKVHDNQCSSNTTNTQYYGGLMVGGTYNEVYANYAFNFYRGCIIQKDGYGVVAAYNDVHDNHFKLFGTSSDITVQIGNTSTPDYESNNNNIHDNTYTGTWRQSDNGVNNTFSNNVAGTAPPTKTCDDILPGDNGDYPVCDMVAPSDYNITAYIVVNGDGTNYIASRVSDGATISSGTNAATVINAALNALPSGRTSLAKVKLQGNFTLTGRIEVKSNYTVLDAVGASLITVASTNVYLLNVYAVSHIRIIGGDWDGNYNGRPGDHGTVTFAPAVVSDSGGSDILFDSMLVHNTGPDAYLQDAMGDSGFAIYASPNVYVCNCEVHHTGQLAIGIFNASNVLIEDNHVHDVRSGIYVYTTSSTAVMNNYCIRYNTVERTFNSGIEAPSLRVAGAAGSNYEIHHNLCIDCGLDTGHCGITTGWSNGGTSPIYHAEQVYVHDNEVYSTNFTSSLHSGGGLCIYANNSFVYNNYVHDIYDWGIYFNGTANQGYGNTISNCGYPGTGYPGAMIYGTSNIFTPNIIKNCKYCGLRQSGSGNVVSPNTYSGNASNTC